MKIKTFGAKHFTGQLPRIEEGFKELGHEIVNENPDLIYANDPTGFDSAIKEMYRNPQTVLILNVLDIPRHLFPTYNLESLHRQLITASAITTISKTTQSDLKYFFNLDSHVIYNPTMPIKPLDNFPDLNGYKYRYLIVGRTADPNKRNRLALEYLQKYEPQTKVAVVGSESVGFGDYFGILPTDILNQFYSSVDYVFSLTKYGGIELPAIEAILAGTIPIVCTDSECAMEFNPEFAADPTPEAIAKKILEISQNSVKFMEIVARKQQVFKEWFDKVKVAGRILSLVE